MRNRRSNICCILHVLGVKETSFPQKRRIISAEETEQQYVWNRCSNICWILHVLRVKETYHFRQRGISSLQKRHVICAKETGKQHVQKWCSNICWIHMFYLQKRHKISAKERHITISAKETYRRSFGSFSEPAFTRSRKMSQIFADLCIMSSYTQVRVCVCKCVCVCVCVCKCVCVCIRDAFREPVLTRSRKMSQILVDLSVHTHRHKCILFHIHTHTHTVVKSHFAEIRRSVYYITLFRTSAYYMNIKACVYVCIFENMIFFTLSREPAWTRSRKISQNFADLWIICLTLYGCRVSRMCVWWHKALNCRSLFAKEPLIIGLFCGKWPLKMRHPTHLRHPVAHDLRRSVYSMKAHEWVVYIHMNIYINTQNIYINTYTVQNFADFRRCVYYLTINAYACTHSSKCQIINVSNHQCVKSLVLAYVKIYTHTYMHTHTQTWTHTNMCTFTQ